MTEMLVLAGKIITSDPALKAVDSKGQHTGMPDGQCLLVRDKKIVEIGTYNELRSKYPLAKETGNLKYWAMPGFINGHYHSQSGYQLRYGILEEPLEIWLLRCYTQKMGTKTPELAYWESLFTNLKMLTSGVTAAVDFYVGVNEDSEYIGCEGGLCAAVDSGMRIALAPTGRDADAAIVYGPNKDFLKSLDLETAAVARKEGFGFAPMDADKFLNGWQRVYRDYHKYDDRIMVFICPDGPQWVTPKLFTKINHLADKYDVKMQTHCMETKYQLLCGLERYGKSYIGYMDDLGVLNERLTLGHGTWLRNEDMALCAKRGVCISHNPGANLRLHSGIAPLRDYLKHGVNMAIGTDNHSFSSDNDYFADLRLAMLLHRGAGMDAPMVAPEVLFDIATRGGAKLMGCEMLVGELSVGKAADIVLVDPQNAVEPFMHPDISAIHALLDKATRNDVRTVLINGELLMEEGRLIKFDLDEVREKYAFYGRKAWGDDDGGYNSALAKVTAATKEWFSKRERELSVNYQYNTK